MRAHVIRSTPLGCDDRRASACTRHRPGPDPRRRRSTSVALPSRRIGLHPEARRSSSCSGAGRAETQRRFRAGELPDFAAGDRFPAVRGREIWQRGPSRRRAGPDRPPGGDHRPGRAQDDDQRAQLRRARLHGRLRGRALAARGATWSRARSTAWTRCGGTLEFSEPRGKALSAGRAARDAGGAAPGLASGRETHAWSMGGAGLREPVRLRPLLLPQRPGAAGPGKRALLLPAQAGEPPRGAAVERRLQRRAGRARHPAGHHPGHGADRDDPRRVRDGGDPLRAAGPRRRAERRAAGTTSSA